MSILLNKAQLRDKIQACWTGKNIGGTVGVPFEGQSKMQDITGYTTPKGEPMPNDDRPELERIWCSQKESGDGAFASSQRGI